MERLKKNTWFLISLALLLTNVATLSCLLFRMALPDAELRVEYFNPCQQSSASPGPEIVFNTPVAPHAKAWSDVDAGLVKIEPSAPGRFTWKDASTIKFVPLAPLPKGTEYKITIQPGLKSATGRLFMTEKSFTFTTERLTLKKLGQVSYSPEKGCVLSLEFSDKVSPEALKKRLRVEEADGKELSFGVTSTPPSQTLTVATGPTKAASIVVKIAGGLQGEGGPMGLESDVSEKVTLDPYFKIREMTVTIDSGEPAVSFSATQDVNDETLKEHIKVEPEIDFSVSRRYYDNSYLLAGDFNPRTSYKVTIKKGLAAGCGKILKEDFVRTVYIKSLPPRSEFKTRGVYMRSEGAMSLPLETINMDEVQVTAYKIYPNNLVYFMRNTWRYGYESLSGQPVVETVKVKGRTDEKVTTNLDLRKFLGGKKCGVHMLTTNRGRDKLVMITDMGLSVKKSGKDLLVWVNSLSKSAPVAGASVTVYSRANQKLLEGVTGKDGIIHFRNFTPRPGEPPFAVAATLGEDMAFLELGGNMLDVSAFDTGGRPFLAKGCEAFLHTDRGVYKPGETVRVNALVRGRNMAPPGKMPASFSVFRPDDKLFKKATAAISEAGDSSADFAIPADARTGRYNISFFVPGTDGAAGTASFLVEDFMPDRIRAEVSTEDRRYKIGDELDLKVFAEYLFGAPLRGQTVKAECCLAQDTFKPEGFKEYNFTNSGRTFQETSVKLGTVTTDEKGSAKFKYKIIDGGNAETPLKLRVSATAFDSNGRAVTARLVRILDSRRYYLGITRSGSGHAARDQEEQFKIVAVTRDGKEAAPPKELEAEILKVETNWALRIDSTRGHRYECAKSEKSVKKLTLKTENGRAFSFAPPSPGDYRVVVRDPVEGVSSDVLFTCASPWADSWGGGRPDRLELKLDKESYKAGTEARLIVKSPVKGPALLTLEGDGVHAAIPFEMSGDAKELKFPVRDEYGSGFYCSVSVLNRNKTGKAFECGRAFGTAPVAIDRSDRRLKVTLAAPVELRPGKKLKVGVEVARSDGRPKEASVALAVVDEGICGLTAFQTPSPFDYFYGKRRLEVSTFDLYSLLMPEPGAETAGKDSRTPGDAHLRQGKFLSQVPSKRVKSAVFWKSGIRTGKNGKAEVEFDLPNEFAGELRIMAVAAAGRDFGNARSALKVRQPLTVISSFPRFLAPDDEFTVPVTVFNKTGAAGEAVVSLEAEDTVSRSGDGGLRIKIDNDKSGVSYFNLRAPPVPGGVKLKVVARMGQETAFDCAEIPLRPPTALTLLGGSGLVKSGETAKVRIPGGWLPGTDEARIVFSDMPTLKLGKALEYVAHYPYGCLEQTTSSAFPMLYLADIASLADPKLADREAVKDFVLAGMDRILSMQTASGGFAMWPGRDEAYPWGSVYASHFLAEAKKAGYDVPPEAADLAAGYLNRLLERSDAKKPEDLETKAYACHVLALFGRGNRTWTETLRGWAGDMDSKSRLQVALAMSHMNEKKDESLLASITIPPPNAPRRISGSLGSGVRDSAMILSGLMDLAPENARVPKLADSLSKALESSRGLNTQENAFALMALGKYARHKSGRAQGFEAEVKSDGKTLAKFKESEQVELGRKDIANKELEVSVKGGGELYYHWTASGVPAKLDTREFGHGVKISRGYFTRDGKPCDPGGIPQGELVVVRLTVEADRAIDNLAISDLLPAGLEIENPRLATTEKINGGGQDGANGKPQALKPDRIEARDDRFLLFATAPEGKSQHSYLARAVTRGSFALPPARAACMYEPEIDSASGAGRLAVGK